MFFADILYPDNPQRRLNLRTKIVQLEALAIRLEYSWREYEGILEKDNKSPVVKLSKQPSLKEILDCIQKEFPADSEIDVVKEILDNKTDLKSFLMKKIIGKSVQIPTKALSKLLLDSFVTKNLLLQAFCAEPIGLILTDFVVDAIWGSKERAALEEALAKIDKLLDEAEAPLNTIQAKLQGNIQYWKDGIIKLEDGRIFVKKDGKYKEI